MLLLFEKEENMSPQNEIILYKPNDTVHLEVRLQEETVWLNRQQMSELFDRDVKTIGKHINNALNEELAFNPVVANNATTSLNPTVANFATVQKEGNREVIRNIEYYNLDVILSVGYRVKSSSGIQFRQWANQILKEYLLKGYAINQRFERIEQRLAENEKQIDFIVRTELPPREGIFYDGQIFDAYKFVSDLIEVAKKEIFVIDNYIDTSVLTLLSKRKENVKATIYTKEISAALQLDLQKHNAQYPKIFIKQKANIHDRFLIIDNDLYHIGASLKDLGRKLFAFSKMEMKANEFLKNIKEK
jgi:hypothetical protein